MYKTSPVVHVWALAKKSQIAHGLKNEATSGDEGNRTPDIYLAKVALCQLSYVPVTALTG